MLDVNKKEEGFTVTGFLQLGNEIQSGHLKRFIEHNLSLFDHLVVFVDGASDGSAQAIRPYADLIIERPYGAFRAEISNRRELLKAARLNLPQTDWFLWLDCDEVLFASRTELDEMLSNADAREVDGIELGLVNLWKSTSYFRIDSGFNSLANVRLWKNSPDLAFGDHFGLHQLMHPQSIRNVWKVEELKVTHFGFAERELILRKFLNYKSLGQSGKNLWRLIDETNLNLEPVTQLINQGVMGERARGFLDFLISPIPKSETLDEYFWSARLMEMTSLESTPKIPYVTLVCLIYKGVDWLEFQYGELLKLRNELNVGEVEILFVANDATSEVLEFLTSNNIPHVIAPGRKNEDEWYINSVYRAYNFGAEQAHGEYLLFVNSDMAYAPNFLTSLLSKSAPELYLTGKLIESGRLKSGALAQSRNLGKTLSSFKRSKFYKIAKSIATDELRDGGLYMPALVNRRVFLDSAGYPEGNINPDDLDSYLSGKPFRYAALGQSSIPGDRAYIQKVAKFGLMHSTHLGAISYHFQEGEKSTTSRRRNSKIFSGIAILNDHLIGINGEKTLWNYLLEDLNSKDIYTKGVEVNEKIRTPYFLRSEFRRGILKNPKPRLIFQNATYLKNFRSNSSRFILLQDKVQNKHILSRQNSLRKIADAEVTNSTYFLKNILGSGAKYLLPLPISPIWSLHSNFPSKISESNNLRAVFIGAFNETKGWSEVKELVLENKDVFFNLVSKYQSDDAGLGAESGTNWQIYRCLPQEQLVNVVLDSDFFVLGSPFETQCLAAIECAMLGKPILMKRTGLLASLPDELTNQIGIFTENLKTGMAQLIANLKINSTYYDPAEALKSVGIDYQVLRQNWADLLLSELERTFEISINPKFVRLRSLASYLPESVKDLLRKIIRFFKI